MSTESAVPNDAMHGKPCSKRKQKMGNQSRESLGESSTKSKRKVSKSSHLQSPSNNEPSGNVAAEYLWWRMANLTFAKCLKKCHRLGSCCSADVCEMMREYAAEKGVVLESTGNVIPFLDDAGKCVVPPHLRPICAVHQCDISGLGFCPEDPEWTRQYFKLRNKLEETL
jgi:hypothetical protein